MKKHVPSTTETAFSSVKDITGGQLLSVKGLRGHLLHTVTFLVFKLNESRKCRKITITVYNLLTTG